jgi:DNA primase
VVEGYMDAIGAHQAGYANVVASMGTALTEAQFRQLSKLCKKFILALDPDVAGVQAMLRGLDVARETLDRDASPVFDARGLIHFEGHLQVDIRVLVMPGGRDPDEVIRDDPAGWPRLVENALPVVEYVLQTLAANYDLHDPKGKAAFSRQVVPIIRDVADPVEREHYIQRLARMLRENERAVREQLGSGPTRKGRRPVALGEPPADRKGSDLEAHCLTAMLQAPGALARLDETFGAVELDPLSEDDFDDAAHRQVLAAIRSASEQGVDGPRELLDESLWPLLAALSAGTPSPTFTEMPDWAREAVQSALRLRERNLKRQQQELNILAREALEEGQPDAARELGEQGHRSALAVNRVQKALWPGEIARLSTADPWHRPAA